MNSTLLTPSPEAFRIIKMFEGFRSKAYKPVPTEKYYTIGYGHCSQDVKKNQYITPQRADELLEQDVVQYSRKLAEFAPTIEQHQYDALVSLIYNIGWYNFYYSMTGQYVKDLYVKRSPIEVARRMILWVNSGEKTLLGLQRRRCFEANYFLGYECFVLENGYIYEHSI